jgi:hypothetical protein
VQACFYIFQGTHNGNAITRVDYYKQNTQEILNSEIYNSISFTDASNIYGNASSATKLLTARTLWGKSFDGTANIDGNISNTGHITPSATNTYSIGTNSVQYRNVWTRWVGGASGQTFSFGASDGYAVYVDTSQNVGIGVSSPAYKLDVNGTARVTDLYIGNIHITYDPDNGGLVIGGGLSTTTYLSALGVNSGGGGGGTTLTEPLSSINTAGLDSPSGSNKFLLWNGSAWTYGTYTSGTTLNEPLASINALGAPSGSNKILLWNGSAWTYGNQSTGGASSLSQLSDVDSNLNPSNGQALVYNSTSHQWEAQTIGGGSGTLTSIGLVMPTGFSVSPATLTANGSFTVSFASGYSLPSTSSQSHWDAAYTFASNSKFGTAGTDYIPITLGSTTMNVLTAHQSLSAYATQTWVSKNYATINSLGAVSDRLGTLEGYFTSGSAKTALKLATARTIWGQNFDGSANVSGNMSDVLNIAMTGSISGTQSIEMNTNGAAAGHGGFIDFHYGGSDVDYSSRIIEEVSGRITIQSRATVADPTKGISKGDFIPSGLIISGGHDESFLQIGDIRLIYDQENNAIKAEKFNGQAANFYATGGVSALGVPTSGSGTVDTLNVNTLKAVNNLYIGDSSNEIFYNYDDDVLTISSGSGDIALDGSIIMTGRNSSLRSINTQGGQVLLGGGFLYLTNSVYLFTDGNNVKVSINGTTYTLNKS